MTAIAAHVRRRVLAWLSGCTGRRRPRAQTARRATRPRATRKTTCGPRPERLRRRRRRSRRSRDGDARLRIARAPLPHQRLRRQRALQGGDLRARLHQRVRNRPTIATPRCVYPGSSRRIPDELASRSRHDAIDAARSRRPRVIRHADLAPCAGHRRPVERPRHRTALDRAHLTRTSARRAAERVRVTLELDREVPYREETAGRSARVFFDLRGRSAAPDAR